MKKVLLSGAFTFLISVCAISQDIITLKSGEQIRAKVVEIGQTEIKYRKFANQSGPLYVLAKSEVVIITYENGTMDSFVSVQDNKNMPGSSGQAAASGTKKSSGNEPARSRFLIGSNFVYPTGTWPQTALTDRGSKSFLKSQGHRVKSFGFGIMIQASVARNFSLFLDANAYNYNIFLADKGADVQSPWTEEQFARHKNEPDAPQVPYVQNLETDVHFDMHTTGMRIGTKFTIGKKNIRPWGGVAFGLYKWEAGYFNEDKSLTYGSDDGMVTGLTILAGIDFEPMTGIVFSPFIDVASPVVVYSMEGLFYPQWDIEYSSPVMGTARIGINMSFAPPARAKMK